MSDASDVSDLPPRPSGADPDERAAESALRPTTLAEFEGQPRVSEQLGLVLEAARHRGGVADHVLLSGPPGLGKTTLAMIIAGEMAAPLRISSGPAIQHAGDLAAILSGLVEGEVFFLDEIHRMSRPAEEMLYLAMEDFRVDVVVGKGPGATAIPLEIPRFTLVGATTRAGLLPGPLRDRFGFTAQLDFYDAAAWSTSCAARPCCSALELDADGGRRDRPPLPRHAPDRQPAAAPGPRLRPGPRRRPDHPSRGAGRARAVRGGRDRPRPAGPGGAGRDVPPVRRRPGGAVDAGHLGGRGAGDGRGGGRAVPGPAGLPDAHPARPGRHPGRLAAPRPDARPPGRHSAATRSRDLVGRHTRLRTYSASHRPIDCGFSAKTR